MEELRPDEGTIITIEGAKTDDGSTDLNDEREKSILRMLAFDDPQGLVKDKDEAAKELWLAAERAWKETGLIPDENFEPVVFKKGTQWAMMMKVKHHKGDSMGHMVKGYEKLEATMERKLATDEPSRPSTD